MAECDLPLVAVENEPCAPLGLGQQIPQILYQDPAGTWPTLTSLATAQAAMTAEGVNRLFTMKNIAAGIVPAATDQTLTGNDVPYGGTIITGRTRTQTGRLQYLGASTVAAVNAINKRGGLIRVGLVDDKGFLQGPIENATITFGALERPGLGQAIPANIPYTLTWDALEEGAISATPLPFLRNLSNAPAAPAGA
jgi:hypothetical protein